MNTLLASSGRRLLCAAALGLVGWLAACEDAVEPPLPQPGSALVALERAAPDDGGMSFTVTGPGIVNARAAGTGYTVYWRLVSSNELRVIVLGRMAAGPLITIDVADLNRLADFQTAVTEVTALSGAPRERSDSYVVRVETATGP
jgi:hypothetical protein